MPKLKANRGKHFDGVTRRIAKSTWVAPEAADRLTVIHECLRDLRGVELIYAIRCPDGSIKIGWTKNLGERRRPLNTEPEAILAIVTGTYDDEQEIHSRLSAHVSHGREYYRATPEVLGFVNELRAKLGVAAIA